jgi:GAF domain-containing protein/HAMP domain-containing protein
MLIAIGTVILLILTWLTISQAFRPISSLTRTASTIAAGDLSAEAPIESEDEIGTLARTFNNMTEQLRGLIDSLEDQVAERTRDLARRTSYLEATAEVGRASASILDTEQLFQQAVDLIRQRFDLYYVGLFLVDEAGQWAVLRAGTGAAGRAMLARNHRIRTGEGMVGWAVAHDQSRVALRAGEDAVRLATAELPETRSEAALPLHSRGQVLGALTVQHTRPGAFDEATMGVLQTMTDQVAAAISNALLFQQAQEALESTRRAYGEVGQEAWRQLLVARPSMGYYCDERGVVPLRNGGHNGEGETSQVADSGDQPELELPVRIQGRTLGAIKAHKPEGSSAWSADEVEVMQTLNEQLAVALEGARLYQVTQQRAAYDRLLSRATARMSASLDVNNVLRSAAEEMRQALDLDRLVVRLATPEDKEPGQEQA